MSESKNIEHQMLQVENELVEYKEKLTDSLEKEAVAFLNAKGGNIYIGVKDNGDIIGVSNIDKLQLQVKDRLINGISPSILSLVSITTEKILDKTILKITLKEGTEKPYYIKNKGLSESGTFIRIGSSAQPMTQKTIYAFQTKSFPKSLINIESPEQELTFADLFIHYRRFSKPLNDSTFAKTLNFLTPDRKYNYLAYLMADNNQLSVRFARFNDAGERFELIEKAIEYGNCCLITAIQRILDRYDIENITLSKLTGTAHRIDKRLVDAKCLREIVINAFAHNDYSYGMLPIFEVFQNRFAIRSYGGLVPQLTINDFFLGVSALRNPELMRILKDLELVEALGFGIRGITKVYDRNIFEFTDNTMYVQLPFEKEVAESETESKGKVREKSKGKSKGKILELITENSQITVAEIAEAIGLSIAGVEKNIRQLKQEDIISRTSDTKSGEWIINI
ncbi:MAG: putative DNA binding domain-containing protein [Paludibacter sp.]|nr:putative DNA binding domain-containing protein [Paludibacter sp.]